ncbi:hypothetical protein HL653_04015 [Sphingomonas sp. AP4-R1]|uniref:hypothetical protein n=1 Tax=Sphingomonas sp. AP4-R1 TaxID=2735134 RepID=UPI001493933F|nr:hypothetical protein [Sphingomonas sp. AP4-R1]QJU57064.1 hypothetical protein HL653_04015 [Sphingomonas sp. AP4-R1]
MTRSSRLSASPPALALDSRRILWIVIAVALLLRLPLVFWELFHHPDEAWQYLEPAHGLVTGWTIVPWEYRVGIRTWLIPTFLTGPIAAGKLLWPESLHYLLPLRVMMTLLSLVIVGYGTALALRISRWHGLVAGLVLATAFDLVYFAARALSDSLAPVLVLPALWLLLPREGQGSRRFLLGGLLLGLAFAVRFQLAPVLGLIALIGCRLDLRRWLMLIGGGVAGLAIDGLADLAQGAVPFRWVIENFRINLVENKSAFYGVEPPLWYAANQIRVWGWATIPILALAAIGARRMPAVALIALANVAIHAVIPHKEYRFLFLSITLVWLLAGVGLGDALALLVARRPGARRWLPIGGVALLLFTTAAIATAPANDTWASNKRVIRLMRAAHDVPGICGLAFVQPLNALQASYAYFDRAVPIYVFDQPEAYRDVRRLGGAFNAAITSSDRVGLLGPGYRRIDCYVSNKARRKQRTLPLLPDQCLFVRAGGCSGTLPADYGMNAALARKGE